MSTIWMHVLLAGILAAPSVMGSLDRVAFVMLNQPGHEDISRITFKAVTMTLKAHGVADPHVYRLGEELSTHGAWTVFPLFKPLSDFDVDWYVLLNEQSRINPVQLDKLLEKHDSKQQMYLGKSLTDPESVIIHHFQRDLEFKFPDFGSAVIMSKALVDDMASYLEFHEYKVRGLPNDFSIDAQYELARTIHLRHVDDSDEEPIHLTHHSQLCTKKIYDNCAVWRDITRQCNGSPAIVKELAGETLFAVKTCKKYHQVRLPVVQETWGKAALNIEFISEAADSTFGTKVLPDVDGNTERGHCMKTDAIFKHFNNSRPDFKWLVIADDDTILSVAKVLQLINCYHYLDDVAIGQRYGFQVASGRHGYDYPTGGAGMIFSRGLVEKIVANKYCRCPDKQTPDDMHIGSCLATLGVSMIHSDRLHQGRPEDYTPDLINHQNPISFHKFWETDPIRTYQDWFSLADEDLAALKKTFTSHDEL